MTNSYAILTVSSEAYQEIRSALEAAGYGDQFKQTAKGEVIDMHGLALLERYTEPTDNQEIELAELASRRKYKPLPGTYHELDPINTERARNSIAAACFTWSQPDMFECPKCKRHNGPMRVSHAVFGGSLVMGCYHCEHVFEYRDPPSDMPSSP